MDKVVESLRRVFGVQLHGDDDERLREALKEKVLKQIDEIKDANFKISWELVQALGSIYEPGPRHPLHCKLTEAMKTGRLQEILTRLEVTDPKKALILVYMALSSERPDLSEWIRRLFESNDCLKELKDARERAYPTLDAEYETLEGVLEENLLRLKRWEQEKAGAPARNATAFLNSQQAGAAVTKYTPLEKTEYTYSHTTTITWCPDYRPSGKPGSEGNRFITDPDL